MKRIWKTMGCLVALGWLCVAGVSVAPVYAATYVGMAKCKECHAKHVETYYTWKYSKSFRIIQMRKRDHDSRCVVCHTTGFGEEGGFVSVEKTPHMANKQCESCHGPASRHVKAPSKREHQKTLSVPRNICTRCHSGHKHPGY